MSNPSIGTQIHHLRLLVREINDDKNSVEDRLIEVGNAIDAIVDLFDEFHDALAPLGR